MIKLRFITEIGKMTNLMAKEDLTTSQIIFKWLILMTILTLINYKTVGNHILVLL